MFPTPHFHTQANRAWSTTLMRSSGPHVHEKPTTDLREAAGASRGPSSFLGLYTVSPEAKPVSRKTFILYKVGMFALLLNPVCLRVELTRQRGVGARFPWPTHASQKKFSI